MTLPSMLLALVIALLYGALYHFARGGNGWRLLLYLGLSALGFFAGELVGNWRGWMLFMLGPLNLGMGTIGSALFLGVGDWLSRIEARKDSGV